MGGGEDSAPHSIYKRRLSGLAILRVPAYTYRLPDAIASAIRVVNEYREQVVAEQHCINRQKPQTKLNLMFRLGRELLGVLLAIGELFCSGDPIANSLYVAAAFRVRCPQPLDLPCRICCDDGDLLPRANQADSQSHN